MKNWQEKTLGELCEINPKLSANSFAPEHEVSFVPMAAVDEISGSIAREQVKPYSEVAKGYTPFKDGDVLFAKITPCMQNGKAAIARELRNGVGFGSTEFHVLRPKPAILAKWIFAFIRQPSFRARAEESFTGTGGQQRVPGEFLKRFPIPVPPLLEQARIVKLLDEADALRKLRAEASKCAAALIPALFDEMFGQMDAKHCQWPREKFENLITIEAAMVDPREEEYLDLPHIGADRIESKSGKLLESKSAREDGLISSKFLFDERDVLYSKIRPNLRKAAIPNGIGLCSADMYPIRPGPKILREFLWTFLLSDFFTDRAVELSARTNMPKLNRVQLNSIECAVPPLPLQQAFATRVAAICALETAQAASRARLEELFQSMLHKAFRGEL